MDSFVVTGGCLDQVLGLEEDRYFVIRGSLDPVGVEEDAQIWYHLEAQKEKPHDPRVFL